MKFILLRNTAVIIAGDTAFLAYFPYFEKIKVGL
jgi:hypothetical protein